ncbi:MFS transporter [Sulfobacillus sp. DSM 109850]|uniref:MFS transporter n=2 Tax=Sulfobacillus harzensis TaxID=2729629 RepID=A0A7Y0Q145_9FIRM|nr:MFS transporter [Sulfobacillus harzensis]
MLAMALTAMDSTIVATAIPTIVRDLGGFALFPWVFSIYLLTQAAMTPIYGKLADLYGRKPILMIGAIIFLLGSALSGVSWSMVTLIIFRGLQGIGAAAIQPIVITLIGDLFSVEERAKMQGYLSSVWGLSAIIGPAIGGFFVQFASWRWVFYINIPIGAAALIALWVYLHERVERKKHQIDFVGSGLLMTAIGLIITGLLEGGVDWHWLSPPSFLTIGGGIVLLLAFLWVESRAKEPVLPIWVFSRRVLLAANLGSMGVGVLTIGLSSYYPTYLQGVLHQIPLVAGFALACMSIGWPLASAFSGRLYLKIGFRNTAILGALVTIVAGVGFATLGLHSSVVLAALLSFVTGVGLGLGSTSLVVLIQSIVPWNRRGVVTGANMFTRQLGSTLGVAVYGTLVNATLAHAFQHPPANVAAHLPHNLNAASLALGSIPNLSHDVVGFVDRALNAGIHHVFIGVLAVAACTFLVEWLLPKKAEPLDFASDGPVVGRQSAES